MTGPTVEQAITRVYHQEWARVVVGTVRRFGDLDVAEEAAGRRDRRSGGFPTKPTAAMMFIIIPIGRCRRIVRQGQQ